MLLDQTFPIDLPHAVLDGLPNPVFVKDAQRYLEQDLNRNIPTLILHGKQDDVINLAVSRAYACQRPWVTLQPLDTDHGMTDSMEKIWQSIEEFCQL